MGLRRPNESTQRTAAYVVRRCRRRYSIELLASLPPGSQYLETAAVASQCSR